MPEKDTIFSSKVKYKGIFSFAEFYKFAHEWLDEEMDLDVNEDKYVEKVQGNAKDIEVKWKGEKKFSDYFKFEMEVKIKADEVTNVEVVKAGTKTQTNKGSVEATVKGVLVKDYDGKFERTATSKFYRSLYEKWIIPSRIEEFEEKVASGCDKFLSQVKAFLDLEGK